MLVTSHESNIVYIIRIAIYKHNEILLEFQEAIGMIYKYHYKVVLRRQNFY